MDADQGAALPAPAWGNEFAVGYPCAAFASPGPDSPSACRARVVTWRRAFVRDTKTVTTVPNPGNPGEKHQGDRHEGVHGESIGPHNPDTGKARPVR
jgi:hypothetical protein